MRLALPLVGDGELMPAFSAARGQDAASVLRGHARAKAMFVAALAAAGLVGAFHIGAGNRSGSRNGSAKANQSDRTDRTYLTWVLVSFGFRCTISAANSRYCLLPVEAASYSTTGCPKLGASERRTFR
jgi:hypothetical protein